MADLVLVTATWHADIDRFAMLRRSLREFAADESFRHIAAVHSEDYERFRAFDSERNLEIIPTAALLPRGVERRRAAAHYGRADRRHWVRGTTIAGWYAQQLTKLAVLRHVDAGAVVFLDSDMVALRPLRAEDYLVDGTTRVFVDGDMRGDGSADWNRVAAGLLAVADTEVSTRQFIHWPTVVDVRSARAMLEHLSGGREHGWLGAMLAANAFEYPTYGAWLVRTGFSGVCESSPLPVAVYSHYEQMWDFAGTASAAIRDGEARFLAVQSRLHIPPASYESILRQAWARSGA